MVSLVLIVFQGCLLVYLLALLWFLLGLFRPEPSRNRHQPAVSVIVAARDENPNFPLLLDQLRRQDYPAEGLECILVDDGLTAESRTLADEAVAATPHILLVAASQGDPQLTYKNRALDAGIRASRGEILLFTDADCQVGPGWVSSLVSYFTPQIDYVVGWSQVGARAGEAWDEELAAAERTLVLFEQIDFAMLMLAARGATLMGTPWASTGQNQAYRRSVFETVGGFRDLARRLQGDDTLFLQHARRRVRARVTFATDPGSRVVTAPTGSLRQFLAQRVRWAGDAAAMWRFNPAFLPIPVAALGVNLLTVFLVLAALVEAPAVLPVLIPGLLLKALGEGALLWIGSRRLPLGDLRRHFPLWFVLQIPYIALVGVAAIGGNRVPWLRRAGAP